MADQIPSIEGEIFRAISQKDTLMARGFSVLGDLASIYQVPSSDRWNQRDYTFDGTGTLRHITMPVVAPIDSSTMMVTLEFTVSNSTANSSNLNISNVRQTGDTDVKKVSRLSILYGGAATDGAASDPISLPTANWGSLTTNTADRYLSEVQQDLRRPFFVLDPLNAFVDEMHVTQHSTSTDDINKYRTFGVKQYLTLKHLLGDNPYQTMEFAKNKFLTSNENYDGGSIFTLRNKHLLKTYPLTDVGSDTDGFSRKFSVTFPLNTDLNRRGLYWSTNGVYQVHVTLRNPADYIRYGIRAFDPDGRLSTGDLTSNFTLSVDKLTLFWNELDTRSDVSRMFRDFTRYVPEQTWVVKNINHAQDFELKETKQTNLRYTYNDQGIPLYVLLYLTKKYDDYPKKNGSALANQLTQVDNDTEFFVLPTETTDGEWFLTTQVNISSIDQTLRVPYEDIEQGEPLGLVRSYKYFLNMLNQTKVMEKTCTMSFDEWKRMYPCLCLPILYPGAATSMDSRKMYLDPENIIDRRVNITFSLPAFATTWLAERNVCARLVVVEQKILKTHVNSSPIYGYTTNEIGVIGDGGDGYVSKVIQKQLADKIQQRQMGLSGRIV